MTFWETLRSASVTLTFAPGTAEWLASVTTPRTEAVKDCASASAGRTISVVRTFCVSDIVDPHLPVILFPDWPVVKRQKRQTPKGDRQIRARRQGKTSRL